MAKQNHPTGYRCKHCKVAVMGKTDFRAILGQVHKIWCPRSK